MDDGAENRRVLHLHPSLVVVDEPPMLIHVAEGWREPIPEEVATALGRFAGSSTIRDEVEHSGSATIGDALADLRAKHVLLDGPSPVRSDGLFCTRHCTIGAALTTPAADAVVVGMPYDVATTVRAGARRGPDGLREVGGAALVLVGGDGVWDPVQGRQVLTDRRVVDVGDIDAPVHHRNGPTIDQLRETVRCIVERGALAVVLGGDHSIAHAVTEGCGEAVGDHVVLQLDAHTDRGGAGQDWRATLHHGNVGDHLVASPTVRHLVQAGIRQRTPAPPPRDDRVTVLPVSHTDPASVVAALPTDLPVHVSIDVDVMDPAVVRGTGTPVPGGLDLAGLVAVVEAVAADRRILAVDCCELIPDDDLPGTLAVAELLARTLIAVLDPVPA